VIAVGGFAIAATIATIAHASAPPAGRLPPAGGAGLEALEANGNVIAAHAIPEEP
jgi:hypothetical protein